MVKIRPTDTDKTREKPRARSAKGERGTGARSSKAQAGAKQAGTGQAGQAASQAGMDRAGMEALGADALGLFGIDGAGLEGKEDGEGGLVQIKSPADFLREILANEGVSDTARVSAARALASLEGNRSSGPGAALVDMDRSAIKAEIARMRAQFPA